MRSRSAWPVKDLVASRAFYEKLDFEVCGGDPAQNWLILRNGTITIGLFQGMFERNILTFNPGWDDKAQAVKEFTDVREHQRRLKSNRIKLTTEADETSTGPASLMMEDPDGNPILVDQHVEAKTRQLTACRLSRSCGSLPAAANTFRSSGKGPATEQLKCARAR